MNGRTLVAKPYHQMVRDLVKPMGSFQADVLHAAVGISGECAELAVARSINDIVLELGDVEFYVEALFQAIGGRMGAKPIVLDDNDPAGGQCLSTVCLHMVVVAGHLLDKAKKAWVYGGLLNEHGVRLDLLRLEVAMRTLRDLVSVQQSDVLRANQTKLGKRYPDQVYTDAAAIARADVGGDQEYPLIPGDHD
jgi:hypothetical protein